MYEEFFFFMKKKIDILTVNPTDHLVNEIFYLFGPVVFLAIGLAQSFYFLKPTSPVLDPDCFDSRGPICRFL